MTTHIGNQGKVKLSSNTVAEVTGFEMSVTNAVSDDSALSDAADTHLAGSYSWQATINAWWDETDTNGQEALTIGASVTLNLHPEGDDSGDVYYGGTATVIEITRMVRRNQTVEATFRLQGNGVLTRSTV